MARVHIPAAMRALTGGAAEVEAAGGTLGEVIEYLEDAYPGLKRRLTEGDRMHPGIAVFVDGTVVPPVLDTRVGPEAEVYLAPAIAGGASDGVNSFAGGPCGPSRPPAGTLWRARRESGRSGRSGFRDHGAVKRSMQVGAAPG